MSVDERQPERLRIGLIGAGQIVARAHLPVLSGRRDVIVAAVHDQHRASADDLAARFQIPRVCGTLGELLAEPLDAVLVATPNRHHSPICTAALEAGRHVLCEKPMATTPAEAEAMAAAAERSGTTLMIGFTNRFRPELVALHQAVQSDALGEIQAVRCGWLRRNGIPGGQSWFVAREQAGGGALTDLGSHLVDLAVWLGVGRTVARASSRLDRTVPAAAQAAWYQSAQSSASYQPDVEISAHCHAVFAEDRDLFLETSWACAVPADRTYLHLRGSRGTAQLETVFGFSPHGHRPAYPLRIWREGRDTPEQIAGAVDLLQPYRSQWQFFIEHLRRGDHLRAQLSDALATVRIVQSLYEAAGA